jgi:hypothetical protein
MLAYDRVARIGRREGHARHAGSAWVRRIPFRIRGISGIGRAGRARIGWVLRCAERVGVPRIHRHARRA